MIISHSKRFCYWKIARTGSSSAELCIRMSGALDLTQDIVLGSHFFPNEHNVPFTKEYKNGHILPRDAIRLGILTQEQYDQYDHYTIVRNPIHRFASSYAWKFRVVGRALRTPEEFFESHDKPGSWLLVRQSEYLELGGVQTFPFSDYETSIRTILSLVGGKVEDVPNLATKTRPTHVKAARNALEHSDLMEIFSEWYADDLNLEY